MILWLHIYILYVFIYVFMISNPYLGFKPRNKTDFEHFPLKNTHPLFQILTPTIKSTLKLSLNLIKHQMTNIIVNHNTNGVYFQMNIIINATTTTIHYKQYS